MLNNKFRNRLCLAIKGFTDKNPSFKRLLFLFTVAFIPAACVVFSSFIVSGRSLIWGSDGWNQHIKALTYYSWWLRDVASAVARGGVIPAYSLSMGLGADIPTTLQYYVIGDPFALLAVFCPTKWMWLYYSIMVLVRLYCAGISFIVFTRKKGSYNALSVVAGGLLYAFCGYAILALRHPYFLNPLILLPLLLYGVDRYQKINKPFFFIAIATISVLSNFYFAWMLALITVLYIATCAFDLGKQSKRKAFSFLGSMVGFGSLALLLASILLVPTAGLVLESSTEINRPWELFRVSNFYLSYMAAFTGSISLDDWTRMGFGFFAVIALALMIIQRTKQDRKLLTYFIVLTLFMMLPAIGRILNGFVYASNRWEWAYALLVIYLVVYKWESIANLSMNASLGMIVIASLYAQLALLLYPDTSRNPQTQVLTQAALVVQLLFIFVLLKRFMHKRENQYLISNILMFVTVLFGVGVMGNSLFAATYTPFQIAGSDTAKEFTYIVEPPIDDETLQTPRTVWNLRSNELTKLRERLKLENDSFVRVSGYNLNLNKTMLMSVSGTSAYWSLLNSKPYKQLLDLGCKIGSADYDVFNLRSSYLMAAWSVNYYYDFYKNLLYPTPYWYGPVKSESATLENGGSFYQNNKALPLGYTLDSTMKTDEYLAHNVCERQELLLQAAVSDELDPNNFAAVPQTFDTEEKSFHMEALTDGVEIRDDCFVAWQQDGKIKLTFDGDSVSEHFIEFKNLRFLDYYFQDANGNMTVEFKRADELTGATNFLLYNPRAQFYTGQRNFVAGSGYQKKPLKTIIIHLPSPGVYAFDEINVYSLPMPNYVNRVERARTDTLQNIDLHTSVRTYATSLIEGDITITGQKHKVLVISLPYSTGWAAYVDGEKTKIHCVNTALMGIELEPGNHSIRLEYETPYMRLGALLSGCGCVGLSLLILLCRKKHKAKRASNTSLQSAVLRAG